jgi:hypothetical protein
MRGEDPDRPNVDESIIAPLHAEQEDTPHRPYIRSTSQRVVYMVVPGIQGARE